MTRNSINKKNLDEIGEVLTQCSQVCHGVCNNPSVGVLPRCLYLEDAKQDGGRGAVVVGMNPGGSPQREREYYIKNGPSYKSSVTYWVQSVKDRNSYYCRIRGFIRGCGLNGPILWTELAKCEKDADWKDRIPIQTYRTCANLYLREELALIPEDWAVFAIGKDAYTATAYFLPERTVVGVPHPTGSFGHFPKIYSDNKIVSTVKLKLMELLKPGVAKAEWLSPSS